MPKAPVAQMRAGNPMERCEPFRTALVACEIGDCWQCKPMTFQSVVRYRSRMIEVGPRDNGRSTWCWQRPLGVACLCGHRALVPLERLGATDRDMRPLYKRASAARAAMPLACSYGS